MSNETTICKSGATDEALIDELLSRVSAYGCGNPGVLIPHLREAARSAVREYTQAAIGVAADNADNDTRPLAHPAWWRGHQAAVLSSVWAIGRILNGADDGAGVAGETWEPIRRRLLALVEAKKLAESVAEQALAENRELAPLWQPIETAPKTGRILLLGYPNVQGNWRTVRGQWISQEEIEEWEYSDLEEGWHEISENGDPDDGGNAWPIEPTHWTPLPVMRAESEVK